MKIFKIVILEVLFLVAMILFGTFTMYVLDLLFQVEHENLLLTGSQVGFTSWLVISVISLILKIKRRGQENGTSETSDVGKK